MQINISTRHGQLSEANQARIIEKVERLSRFHERLASVQVTVDLDHEERPEVEIAITVEKAGEFVAAVRSDNLLASVDGVVHKLEQQLKRHREKATDHRVPGRRLQTE